MLLAFGEILNDSELELRKTPAWLLTPLLDARREPVGEICDHGCSIGKIESGFDGGTTELDTVTRGSKRPSEKTIQGT
jgi:hypothetical protein